jgi:hypothetical protein
MDCPKYGETERGVEKCANDMESLREGMNQTMDLYANEMETLRRRNGNGNVN